MVAKSSVTEMITRVIEILQWIDVQMKFNKNLQALFVEFEKKLCGSPGPEQLEQQRIAMEKNHTLLGKLDQYENNRINFYYYFS